MTPKPLRVEVPRALQVEAEQRAFVPERLRPEDAKVLAFKLKVPVRTVENWQQGRCLPNTAHWIALCELIPEFRDRTLEWLAAAMRVDPLDETRLLHEVQTLLLRRQQSREAGQ